MDSRNESNKFRVVMLPWLAYSHISSFLELAKRMSNHNFHVYLSSTPINLHFIKNNLSHKHSHSIELVEINLSSSPELPPHYHTTNGLPVHLNTILAEAFQKSSPVFTSILEKIRPHLLIYDFNQSWAAHVASCLMVPSVMFSTGSAAAWSVILYHVTKQLGEPNPFPEIEPKAQEYEFSLEDSMAIRSYMDAMNMSHGFIMIKSSRELEGKYIDYMSQSLKKKVLPIGALIQEPSQEDDHDQHSEIFQWLDMKEDSSVVFISLGSECYLSNEEIQDIAYGLELSKVSFIWVIRFPHDSKTSVQQVLPQGFLTRLGERCMVLEKWAPQAKILSHSSIGGFISHCGWCSIMESICYGVPIIAMPMQYDQPYNAKLLEAIGGGVIVGRDEEGRVKREDMAEVVRKVVVEEGGRSMREKVVKLSEIMKRKGDEEVDRVGMENLVKLCQLKN